MNPEFLAQLEAELSEHVDEFLADPEYCGCDACYWHKVTTYVVPKVLATYDDKCCYRGCENCETYHGKK